MLILKTHVEKLSRLFIFQLKPTHMSFTLAQGVECIVLTV